MDRRQELERLLLQFGQLGIARQIDYNKFYLYSIITHSTAIEGSTVTEVENQMLFDHGITAGGHTLVEQYMNLDLRAAYEKCMELAAAGVDITVDVLKKLSSITMRRTGRLYRTALGDFDSSKGDLRLLNVTAGFGGRSYMGYDKVPAKLQEFCRWLNEERKNVGRKTAVDQYLLSFDAHYGLVTIHPWADGNGRMARLLMNMIQFEFGLIPAKIRTEDKAKYIDALVRTRENDDRSIFRDFMLDVMIGNLSADMAAYVESAGEVLPAVKRKEKNREKIVRLLGENPNMTTATLAEAVGISPKGVERHLANLKREGVIVRIGPDKGGHWEVVGQLFKLR